MMSQMLHIYMSRTSYRKGFIADGMAKKCESESITFCEVNYYVRPDNGQYSETGLNSHD